MNLKLEIEFSKAEILQEVDALKKQIDDMRPLPDDVEGRVMQKLRLDWNYNSNAIEGNKLNYGETIALLMHGITAKGKPLKDHLDIQGHNQAIDFLLSIIKEKRQLSEADIRSLHKVILVEPTIVSAETEDGKQSSKLIKIGEYKTSPNHVKTITGEIHYYASPQETPAKMQELMEWFHEASSNSLIHPVVLAALFHHKFVNIHPFDDGNGRMARILMNLVLMKSNFPPAVIRTDDRQNYYSLLSQADVGENQPFIEYITQRLLSALQLYIKALSGGDIDEDEDIDKEITLLKMQLNGGVVAKEKMSKSVVQRVFVENIIPLAEKIEEKLAAFREYFFAYHNRVHFLYVENKAVRREVYSINNVLAGNFRSITDRKSVSQLDIQLSFEFQDYKDPANRFNLGIILPLKLEEFYYKLLINDEIIISKLYHEKLSTFDQAKVIKYVIKDIKDQLNSKQKSLDSQ